MMTPEYHLLSMINRKSFGSHSFDFHSRASTFFKKLDAVCIHYVNWRCVPYPSRKILLHLLEILRINLSQKQEELLLNQLRFLPHSVSCL